MPTMSNLARRAVAFGLPTVDLHRILVSFALDPSSPEYKGPLNEVHHASGLADPGDLSIVAMNVDTPYSYAWLDLRGGPVLLSMPAHEPDRYMSAQIVDLWTNIVGYVSPRTSGCAGGVFLVRGPAGGETDQPVDGVLECPTDLCLVLVRTQLFGEDDLDAVDRLRDQVAVRPLGPARSMPPTAPSVDVRRPFGVDFLHALDWMLQFMPTLREDRALVEDLAGLGLGVGLLDAVLSEPSIAVEVQQGLAEGLQDVQRRCAEVRSSAELFGSREFFARDYLRRSAGAYLGILGNAAEEYLGVGYQADENGHRFDGSRRYAITFAAGDLPPVDAFWSITVYDADQHLYDNEVDRYVLGSRQLGSLRHAQNGSVTILVQHERPDDAHVPNWLPCPAGPFLLTFRTYLPRAAIRDGSWTAPPVRVVD